jgi:two-component system, NtrC family, sensor kinase
VVPIGMRRVPGAGRGDLQIGGIWTRVMPRLGLRMKFFLYSNTLIAVTMSLVTVLAVIHDRSARYEALQARGTGLAEALAIPIANALASSDDADGARRIDGYIADVLDRNLDLMRYVMVVDEKGVVTNASRELDVGRRLGWQVPATSGRGLDIVEVPTRVGGERILEVRVPVAQGQVHHRLLAVGFSREPLERQVRVLAYRAGFVALILMVGNSVLTALYVETLIRPILNLNRTMKRASRGNLAVRAPARGQDEVGELGEVFNQMMDELEEAHELEQMQRARLAHTEKMAAVGTLAAGVAHEVNNPLAGILTCIENMRSSPDDVEMRERYLVLIHDGLKRIEHTVATLLDFSRQRPMSPEPTSVNHNLRHVVELAEFQLRQAGIGVVLELDPEEPTVLADHFQMEQLFLNLVLNAIQSMSKGGTLTVRTWCRSGQVVAEVLDTGIGISDEIRDRIFDPFFTTREVGEGTGLGLAVSDSIVAAHGGTLEVESRTGEGSTFRVSLKRLDGHGEEGSG